VRQPGPASEALTSRQFRLGSLLLFVLMTSLWCSQIAVLRSLVLANTDLLAATSVASVLVAWIALSWFSFRQRLFVIFVFQGLVPGLMGFGMLVQSFGAPPSLPHDSWATFFGVTLGTNLIWFPIAAVAMAIRWAWPAATARGHDRRMPWWP
jgi:hypothetical protein